MYRMGFAIVGAIALLGSATCKAETFVKGPYQSTCELCSLSDPIFTCGRCFYGGTYSMAPHLDISTCPKVATDPYNENFNVYVDSRNGELICADN